MQSCITIHPNNELLAKIDDYRRARKEETGKAVFRETAIYELIHKAVDGFSPPAPLTDRLTRLEERVMFLESLASS
jgi:hypothetical protein